MVYGERSLVTESATLGSAGITDEILDTLKIHAHNSPMLESRPRKREYVLMAIVLALALFSWHGGDKPEDRVLNGAAGESGQVKVRRDAVVVSPAAPLCQHLVRGQWLYGAIQHSGDLEKLRIECWYGHGAQRFIL